jgi:hypothetical protein
MELIMSKLQRYAFCTALVSLTAVSGAFAQISSINSATYHPREFNDIHGSSLTVVSNYPGLVAFEDKNVSAATGFANRHVWRFSNNNGASAFQFSNNYFFTVTMTLTLTGDPALPRKEAGFLFDTLGGQGQFILDTDAHEIVAFGGPLPFYAFPATFHSGDTVNLGMTYFMDTNGMRAIIYSANCLKSPPLEFSNLEQGIIDNSTLGGYIQVVNAPADPTNSAMAVFQNIKIGPPDQDFDGVPDSVDSCPNTPPCEIVNAQGCSIDQLVPCAGPANGGTWTNHTAYLMAITNAVSQFQTQGLISGSEAATIETMAAQSECGERPHHHRDHDDMDRRDHDDKGPGDRDSGHDD